MRTHQRRQPGFSFGSLCASAASRVGGLTAHPLRTGLLGLFAFTAVWTILTKSLPYALAPTQPELALRLNPNNPVALVTKAEGLRNKLWALPSAGKYEKNSGEEKKAALSEEDLSVTGAALRNEIRELALRAISADPLNARAFQLLAETSDGTNQIRIFMQDAFQRSRRESVAALWLLSDSFRSGDYNAALRYADILLRTHRQLDTIVFGYLCLIAEDALGRELLAKQLATNPAWRTRFFEVLPSKVKNPEIPLALMSALHELGKDATQKEIGPYLNYLISADKMELAYNAWLQFLPRTHLEDVGLLANANFEREPSGLPFDWQLQKGVNAIAEIVPLSARRVEQVLHITFGYGRVKFPEVTQFVLLAPGRYRFGGKLRGTITGKRGLEWQLRCASGTHRVLSQTEMLLGDSQQWRSFAFEAEIPNVQDCRGQALRLFHDSRSASEELLSGEVWFSDLVLKRIPTVIGQ